LDKEAQQPYSAAPCLLHGQLSAAFAPNAESGMHAKLEEGSHHDQVLHEGEAS
jgi:hypothetical protein